MASFQSLPDYWLSQPSIKFGKEEASACDAFLAKAMTYGVDRFLDYNLPFPKWRFFCYVAEQQKVALHGSNNMEIESFEARQSNDLQEFGAQKAVYAAADGIWPMYFAIVDREKSPSIINAAIQIEQKDGSLGEPYYLFSISKKAIGNDPYRNGAVYLLPLASFVHEPPIDTGTVRVQSAQLASLEDVVPFAKILVAPEDFPFLAEMRSHDDERLQEYATAMMQGLPWPE